MRLQKKNKKLKAVSLSVILFLVWTITGANHSSTSASAQTSQTIVLKSGNGAIGGQDPINQCATEGSGTYQDAFIVAPHPAYSVIPGTQYISASPDSLGPLNEAIRFRAVFQLPVGFSNPSMNVQVFADNVATVFVNGVQVYQQTMAEILENFQAPAQSVTVDDASLFHSGANTLEFEIYNYTSITAFDYEAVINFETVTAVALDIKPTSCPNPLTIGEKGVLPVAVLGTADFDVTKIDPASLTLEGVAPLRDYLEDVAAPFLPIIGRTNRLDCNTDGPDGFLDLTLKFDHRTVMAALGPVVDGQVRVLKLTGNLKPEHGGATIAGEDVTVIVKKK
jgi:hypothetical protein